MGTAFGVVVGAICGMGDTACADCTKVLHNSVNEYSSSTFFKGFPFLFVFGILFHLVDNLDDDDRRLLLYPIPVSVFLLFGELEGVDLFFE